MIILRIFGISFFTLSIWRSLFDEIKVSSSQKPTRLLHRYLHAGLLLKKRNKILLEEVHKSPFYSRNEMAKALYTVCTLLCSCAPDCLFPLSTSADEHHLSAILFMRTCTFKSWNSSQTSDTLIDAIFTFRQWIHFVIRRANIQIMLYSIKRCVV